jgi:hypothetical protein
LSEIQHEDICIVFDQLNGNDMVFADLTKENEQFFAIRKWEGGEFTLCGGVVLYDMRNPLVKSLWKTGINTIVTENRRMVARYE